LATNDDTLIQSKMATLVYSMALVPHIAGLATGQGYLLRLLEWHLLHVGYHSRHPTKCVKGSSTAVTVM